MSPNRDDKLVRFIDENRDLIDRLFERIKTHRLEAVKAALQPGETEYAKGRVTGLEWCLGLPDRIINESQGADT